VTRLATLESAMGDALSGARTTAALIGGFSLLALLLASLGIYAVVSFTVARRAAEMGIRVALGAASRSLVAMVVAESLATVGVGVGVGLVLALVTAPRLEGLLYQVGGQDPAAFAGGALVLMAVAAFASWLPARRAARADPVEALRAQ
jgi:ABC-type antimicrobial peptide transport system permease subunit